MIAGRRLHFYVIHSRGYLEQVERILSRIGVKSILGLSRSHICALKQRNGSHDCVCDKSLFNVMHFFSAVLIEIINFVYICITRQKS